jgi:hypothetical protein
VTFPISYLRGISGFHLFKKVSIAFQLCSVYLKPIAAIASDMLTPIEAEIMEPLVRRSWDKSLSYFERPGLNTSVSILYVIFVLKFVGLLFFYTVSCLTILISA